MVLDLDMGVLLGVAGAVITAWWGMAKMFVGQFERRQNERFAALQESISGQKRELDGHLSRQDTIMAEIRRVENELARCQVEAATKYQTRDDAGKQFGQLIDEIRALAGRIDLLHGRVGAGQ